MNYYRGYSIDAFRLLAETSIRRLLVLHTPEARAHARKWLADLRAIRGLS